MSRMRWRLQSVPDEAMRASFPELHPIAVQMLWNRGIRDQAAADAFLLPDYGDDIHDPFLLKDMRAVCERVWRAIDQGEKVVVYSDYDADGVTGAAITISTMRAVAKWLGKDASLIGSYIPHREKEGYGVKAEAVAALCQQGMQLMVTVDCGIGSAAEVEIAAAYGCDSIVIDHHQVPEQIPACLILHPQVIGEPYPFKHLAAAGVAFKFACGLLHFAAERGVKVEAGFDKWLLDLVAIATVTDFMPLLGENRTLEKWGLVVLNKTRRPGLRQLIKIANLTPGSIDTYGIGFGLGPRLNAASRMDHADVALELLLVEDEEEAAELAQRLHSLNSDRQKVGEIIATEARAQIVARGPRPLHVLAGEGWPAGVIGIIAGKLVTENGVPVFVFTREEERFVGSGRSIPEFNVMEGLAKAGCFATHFGGHPQACGVTVEGAENFEKFSVALEAHAANVLAGMDLRPVLDIDAVIQASDVEWDLLAVLDQFEPFGEANRRPKFLLRDCRFVGGDRVGRDGKHARLTLRGDSPRLLKAIAFGQAEGLERLLPGDPLDLIVELGADEWNGVKRIQIRALDFQPAGTETIVMADFDKSKTINQKPKM